MGIPNRLGRLTIIELRMHVGRRAFGIIQIHRDGGGRFNTMSGKSMGIFCQPVVLCTVGYCFKMTILPAMLRLLDAGNVPGVASNNTLTKRIDASEGKTDEAREGVAELINKSRQSTKNATSTKEKALKLEQDVRNALNKTIGKLATLLHRHSIG